MKNTCENICYCPIMSTAKEKVECNEMCEWYKESESASPHDIKLEGQCAITEILEILRDIKKTYN